MCPLGKAERILETDLHHSQVVGKGTRLCSEVLGRLVDQPGDEEENHQSHPDRPVHAPVDERQQQQEELLIGKEGESPEQAVELGAEPLQPQHHVDTPVEYLLQNSLLRTGHGTRPRRALPSAG